MLVEIDTLDWTKKIVWFDGNIFTDAALVSKNMTAPGYNTVPNTVHYGIIVRSTEKGKDIIKFVNEKGVVVGSSFDRKIYNVASDDKANLPLDEINDQLVKDLGTF